jgi:hypothetical protein
LTTTFFASKPAIAVIGLACGLTLAGGVATAASSGGGSVKACVNAKGYLATAIKGKCAHGTHALKLNLKGARGAKGQPGTKGASGSSSAYVGIDHTSILDPLSGTAMTVESIAAVPAGHYIVSWDFEGMNANISGTAASSMLCHLDAGSLSTINRTVSLATGNLAVVAATSAITTTAAGSIHVDCTATGGTTVFGDSGDLVATPVAAETVG